MSRIYSINTKKGELELPFFVSVSDMTLAQISALLDVFSSSKLHPNYLGDKALLMDIISCQIDDTQSFALPAVGPYVGITHNKNDSFRITAKSQLPEYSHVYEAERATSLLLSL